MYEKELAFFIEKQDELVSQFNGKVLVIKGEEVVGSYDSALDAYLSIRKNGELGKEHTKER
jgi:hypothetical protein